MTLQFKAIIQCTHLKCSYPAIQGCVWLVIPNLPKSENGRLRRDGNTVPNQTQNSSKQQISDSSLWKCGFKLKNEKTCPMLGNNHWPDSIIIIIATPASTLRFQSFANKNENLPKVHQTFRLLEQKARQAFQTCQTCRFQTLVVNQTQIPSLPSPPSTELAPIKHTPKQIKLQKLLWNLLGKLLTVNRQPSTVNRQPSTVNCAGKRWGFKRGHELITTKEG